MQVMIDGMVTPALVTIQILSTEITYDVSLGEDFPTMSIFLLLSSLQGLVTSGIYFYTLFFS